MHSDGADCISLLLLSLVLSVHVLSLLLELRPVPCVTDIACGCDDDAAAGCGGAAAVGGSIKTSAV